MQFWKVLIQLSKFEIFRKDLGQRLQFLSLKSHAFQTPSRTFSIHWSYGIVIMDYAFSMQELFRKTNISYPLIRTRSFSEYFAYVPSELSRSEHF